MTMLSRPIEFAVDDSQLATEPAELRGRGRDDIRLMVTTRASGRIDHDVFANLSRHLRAGDVIVVNTSATIPAAIDAIGTNGARHVVHFSSPVAGGRWAVEVRQATADGGTAPDRGLRPQTLQLPASVSIHLLARSPRTPRLWVAAVEGVADVIAYLNQNGRPIRYVPGPERPIGDYQTIFAIEPGSAEMPSAGRPFTPEIVAGLVGAGIVVVPVVLHAGVSSYEDHETPGDERYVVPPATASVVNDLRRAGGRVIAVGTTVVRALETVSDESGEIHPGKGVTDLVVAPGRGVRGVDGLLTGWHEPKSSHLWMLEAFSGRDLLQRAYETAVETGYLWHEFGDELLILP
jgi:S-adenosylmethionine:tRNA ribosyltransferase-isomerase